MAPSGLATVTVGTPWLLLITLTCLALIGGSVLVALRRQGRRRDRWHASHCMRCGYDMRGVPAGGAGVRRCPECGDVYVKRHHGETWFARRVKKEQRALEQRVQDHELSNSVEEA